MIGTLFSSYLLAQHIAPREINHSAVSQQARFFVQVGNPTKKSGQFYVDPVSVTKEGVPSFDIEQGVQLSARKISLRSGALRRINAIAKMGNGNRNFFICTSPAEPTLIQKGTREKPALGIRARACALIQLKQLNHKEREVEKKT